MPRPRSRLSSISYRRDRSSSGSSSDARSYTSVSSLGLSSRDASPTRKISSRPAKTGSTFLAPNAETRSRRNGRRGRLSRQTSPPPFPLNVPPRPSTPPPVLPADDASEPSKSPQETDATIGSSKDSTTIINLPVSAEGVSITRASPSIQGEPGTVIRIDLSGIWGAIATPTPTAAEPSADDSADPVPDPSTQDDTDSTEEPEEPEVVPPEPKIPASDFYPKNPFEPKPSKAAFEWQRQKNLGASNAAIDELMELVGLEEVKEQVLAIQAKVDICRRQGIDLREAKERFNVVFQGNPGTGKTTVARIYARILASVGALKSSHMVETSGAKLADAGPKFMQAMIRNIVDEHDGGVIFVDEAYQLTAPHSSAEGRQVLDILLTEMENNIGSLVVIFVGYDKEMLSFFEHNPGLASRVPYNIKFADFDDSQLWTILRDSMHARYGGRTKLDIKGGMEGLSVRVAIRRLGRGRGFKGFGNARSVENLVSKIAERQANRLWKELKSKPNIGGILEDEGLEVFGLTQEDLIGPDPSKAILECPAWDTLNELIGLDSVKESARCMIDMVTTNYIRELHELRPLNFSLNRVFVGSPGTGKTTVARLYGEILAHLGMISDGEVIVKNPADFIGQCLGKSEAKTRAILQATVGKVLIIDEAYMLDAGGPQKQQDQFRTAVIDTLVAEVQSVPGEDRCILMLGYEENMRAMFQNANPGLARRFAFEDPFRFQDFDDPHLERILDLKLKQQDLGTTGSARKVALDLLSRARMRPNFSNGGEVEQCLSKAKLNYQNRQSKKEPRDREFTCILTPEDFDPNYKRTEISSCSWLKSTVSEDIIKKLEGYQELSRKMKLSKRDPRDLVPTNFVFKGPPGTGKTTTALGMGKVYYDMGFLSTDEVIECSASDLIGQYVGQTGPKTKTQLERGLGKVLFIDEAYRLAEGQYATEAVNELIYLLTTPRYSGKMIVILGGYTADMNKLMNVRPGLSGRFPEEIEFSNIPTHECIAILSKELKDKKISAAFLDDPKNRVYKNLVARFRMLAMLPSWSNARDVKALAKEMAAAALNEAYKSGGSNGFLKDISLSEKQAKDCTTKMYEMQKARCSDKAEKCSSAENSGGGSPQAQTDTCTDTPMSFDIDTAPPAAFTSNASEASPAIATAATADIDVETAPSAFVNKGKGSGEEPTEATVDMEAESSKPSAVSLGKKKASEAAAATTADIEVEAESPEPSAVSLGKKKASEEEPEAAPAKEEEEPQKESDDPSQAQQTEPDEIVPKCIIRESEIEEDSENQLPKKKPPSQPELPSTPTADIEIAEEDIEEEEDEEVIESTQEEDGLCEAGYPWLKEGNGYRCGGGTHTRGDVGSGGTHISGTNGSFGRGNSSSPSKLFGSHRLRKLVSRFRR